MKKILICSTLYCFFILFNSFNLYAQTGVDEKINCINEITIMPKYKGEDMQLFINELKRNIKTPIQCEELEVEGDVIVEMIITKKGRIKNAKITKSPHPALAKPILDWITSNKTEWEPAISENKKVNYHTTLTIPFDFTAKRENYTKPRFNGVNAKGFEMFVQRKVVFPKDAMADRAEGDVTIEFTINKNGKPVDFKVIESPNYILTEETIKSIIDAGEWTPATKNGEIVAEKVIITVTYQLPQKLDSEPMLRINDLSTILDRDDLINTLKFFSSRGVNMELEWYIMSDGSCYIEPRYSYSHNAVFALKRRFESPIWVPARYGGKNVSVKYDINISGGMLRYNIHVLMDKDAEMPEKKDNSRK